MLLKMKKNIRACFHKKKKEIELNICKRFLGIISNKLILESNALKSKEFSRQ